MVEIWYLLSLKVTGRELNDNLIEKTLFLNVI